MKMSFQTEDNKAVISELESTGELKFTNSECFRAERSDHKFDIGQRLVLHGMENYPEYNGEVVTITSIREDGPHGKAYYIKADNPKVELQLNWTYEYRLKETGWEVI